MGWLELLFGKNESLDDVNIITSSSADVTPNPAQSYFDKTINPSDNIKETVIPEPYLYMSPMKDGDNYGSLIASIQNEATSKKELKSKLDQVKGYDYIETILRDVGTDVLTKSWDKSQGEFFKVKMTDPSNKELEGKVNTDIKVLGIYQWLSDIIEDLLLYGQYILKLDLENMELDDNLIQEAALPIYSKGDVDKLYIGDRLGDERMNNLRKALGIPKPSPSNPVVDASDYLILTLFTSYKNIPVLDKSDSFYTIKIPHGIIPESIIPKIVYLKLLESLQPLIELQAMDQKMFFYIRFPPGHDVSEAYKTTTRYEKFLKSILTLDTISLDNINQVIEKVSTVKVIPLFGDQSQMESQSLDKINRIDLNQINDLRNSISSALRIKINDDNQMNLEYIRLIKRLRMLISISLAEFIRNFVHKKYGVKLTLNDFEVVVPELYGTDELDTLEYLNLHSSSFKDILDTITNTAETLNDLKDNPYIDHEELVKAFSEKLKKMTGLDVLRSPNHQ